MLLLHLNVTRSREKPVNPNHRLEHDTAKIAHSVLISSNVRKIIRKVLNEISAHVIMESKGVVCSWQSLALCPICAITTPF